MKNVRLVLPSQEYLDSYLIACKEMRQIESGFFSLHDPDDFENWKHTIFHEYTKQRSGVDLKPGYVPATTYWLVSDDEYIGTGNIRHSLTEALRRFGGHIGYAIRPSVWNQGYGTLQLKFLLREAYKLGIDPALITCDLTNIASARVMEKNGGKRMDVIENIIDGRKVSTCRYWVDTHCD